MPSSSLLLIKHTYVHTNACLSAYVLRVGHLGWDNLLGGNSRRNLMSPSPASHELHAVICLRVKPYPRSPFTLVFWLILPLCCLVEITTSLHIRECSSPSYLADSLAADALFCLSLQTPHLLVHDILWAIVLYTLIIWGMDTVCSFILLVSINPGF